MKTISSSLLVALALYMVPAALYASPLDDKIADLQKAIKAQVASKPVSNQGDPQSRLYANSAYVAASLNQMLSQLDNPNTEANAESQISQLLAAFPSDAVQKAGEDLLVELKKERKDRAEAAAAQIQDMLKRVADGVNQAKKPEDLDELLVDLQKFQNERNNMYNPDTQALYQQVNSAFEFTKLWQNYLSHLASGQTQLATNDLQNLSQNNYAVGIIPRSRILALLAPPSPNVTKGDAAPPSPALQVQDILKGIKTLDQMESGLNQLLATEMNNNEAQMARNALAPMVEAYNNIKAGLPTNLNLNYNFGNQAGVTAELQAQLLVFALQHYLDAYKGAAPGPGEKPQDFITRVTADATARADWPLLQKALTAQGYLNRSSSFGMYAANGGSTNVDNLLIGLNQEAAGQFALAVVSYQAALKTPDINVPARLIGDKLDAIKRDHPKEYDDGMQLMLSPPMPRYYPGQFPGQLFRPGMPGYPMPQTPPSLVIPASTNQTATPTPPATNAPAAK